jgi:hypothetical protein
VGTLALNASASAEEYAHIDCGTAASHQDEDVDLDIEFLDLELDGADPDYRSALQNLGYFPADGLKRSCTLGSTIYRVEAATGEVRASAICGAAPDTYISLYQDGRRTLSVVFGENCWMQPAITRLTFFKRRAGLPGSLVRVCYMTDGRIRAPYQAKPGCASLSREEWEKSLPFTQDKFEKSVENWVGVHGI